MKEWTTTHGCIIYQFKGRSNAYLVLDGDISILVDTGHQNARKKLEKDLDQLLDNRLDKGLDNELSYLVLTHTHYDHVENAQFIKEKYGAKVVVHCSEADNLEQGNSTVPEGTIAPTKLIVALGKRFSRFNHYSQVTPVIMVDKNYSLSPHIQIIHTPGHSKGSLSVIVDNEIALVGDAMFGVFKGIFPPFADDIPTLINSWGKLLETGCQVFLPGHGSENSRDLVESEYKKYIKKYKIEKEESDLI